MASTPDTASSEGPSPSPSFDRQPTPDPQLVQTYHDLMLSTLPQDALPQPTLVAQEASNPLAGDEVDEEDNMVVTETGEKRSMTKGEKQNAKKKRRKEREKAMKMEIERQMAEAQAAQQGDAGKVEVREEKLVDFRLFSTCNVKPVSLLPAPEVYPIPANPRYQPLPAHQQARIHQLAVETAVESDNLGGYPDHPRWSRTDVTPRDFSVSHQALPTLPDMFIGTLFEDAVRTDQPSKPVAKSKSTAKPISTIPLASSHTSCPAPTLPPVSKKRTRRGRRAIPSRTAPHFWAPPKGLGGKARGYAWGFRDSREGRREEGWGTYIRGTTI
ncbi:hypothetical protein L198_03535 [Cryptococcus wingfieldii CBS 7118]|uniref:Uncharacterized protein n=1 Tax=Cryptococcus wingfieldii CBS 7118 TaxID=1295528 RepID=A0A1E3JBS5_9TREE|nr:hypothetical protein L198_03535 [Cryptococcus wingfieldii CBS 7118]ODN98292.1 hypothetical protein L198_03535 [Cryptococcus wingfieldii CBS 7118]